MTFAEINGRVIGGKHHGKMIELSRGRVVALATPQPMPTADVAEYLAAGGGEMLPINLSKYRLESITTSKRRIYFWVPDEIRPEDVPEYLVGMALKATP